MVYQSFEGCQPKQNPHISLNFLTDIVRFSSRIIRLVINTIYVYRFLTAINEIRLRSEVEQDDNDTNIGLSNIRVPYMCATRHHLSVQPDVIELKKELRKIMYRFKLEVRTIAHTIQHYPHLFFRTIPLFESCIQKLQCSLDDLEMAATFNGKTELQSQTTCQMKKTNTRLKSHYQSKNNNRSSLTITKTLPIYQTESVNENISLQKDFNDKQSMNQENSSTTTTQISISRESDRIRRLEADEEQVYLIARNIHLTLHTLMINAKLVQLSTKNGMKAGGSTLLFPFIYDIGKKFCLAFHHLQLLAKYISYRAIQTEHRPVPPLTDFRVNLHPINRHVITEANQFLVDNFAKTIKKRHVKFNVATQQCLSSSILTRRFSNFKSRQ